MPVRKPLLFAASGSKTVAGTNGDEASGAQVFESLAPPAGVECVAVTS
jgi:hypothetical protein